MKFSNMKIGTRLGWGFGLVLFLLVALALTSLSRLTDIKASLDEVINERNVITKELNDMRQAIMIVAVAVPNMSMMVSADEVTKEVKRIEDANASYKESAAVLEAVIKSSQGKALLEHIVAARAEIVPAVERAIDLARRQAEVIPYLISNVTPKQAKLLAAMDEMMKYQDGLSSATAEKARQAYDTALMLTLGLAGAALLLGSLTAWYVTRSITAPLTQAVDVARRVASGDLTTHVTVRSTDETGQLMQALKDMNESLVRIVQQVHAGTETITSASGEIASGNMNLSARTEEQAGSLQMTASSMEELTTTVKHNAENASQANKLAATASDVAIKGGAVVSQVVETMGSINESANKIVDIIGVIDGIAFQTNILALNAAVEAARAGEQGRGFAVVAAEVRNLAQRSAAAAKEIKTLIGDSVEKVGVGAKLVDQAGATMDEVVSSVKRVTDIISEIAAASHQQTAGIEQINQALVQMDNVTQQNAALVEEAAAAASSMQEQAGNLSQVVSVFKLEHRPAHSAPPRPAMSPVAPMSARPAPTAPARPAGTAVAKTMAGSAALPPAMRAGTDQADWEEF